MHRFNQVKRRLYIRRAMTKKQQNKELDRIADFMFKNFPFIKWEGVKLEILVAFTWN